jgi:hypothetical protein
MAMVASHFKHPALHAAKKLDFVTLAETHNGFFPRGTKTYIPAHPAVTNRTTNGSHFQYFDTKQLLDSVSNLDLVGILDHTKYDLIALLL